MSSTSRSACAARSLASRAGCLYAQTPGGATQQSKQPEHQGHPLVARAPVVNGPAAGAQAVDQRVVEKRERGVDVVVAAVEEERDSGCHPDSSVHLRAFVFARQPSETLRMCVHGRHNPRASGPHRSRTGFVPGRLRRDTPHEEEPMDGRRDAPNESPYLIAIIRTMANTSARKCGTQETKTF